MRVEAATPDRWDDVVGLFGPNGAYANCWCTWWMWRAAEWDRHRPDERRAELAARVAAGEEPGLLAYDDGDGDDGGTAIGWCALAPRDRYARLTSPRARTYAPVDERPSWVVTCFYIRPDRRDSGVAGALLAAVAGFVAARGGDLVEAYPVEHDGRQAAASLFTGTLTMFLDAGFNEVARRGDRPLVRLELPRRR